MKLRTRLEKKLPNLYATDGTKGDLPAVYVRIERYLEDGSETAAQWVIWEYDPETKTGFGLCDLMMGFPEIGYVAIPEIEQLNDPFRRGLEMRVSTEANTRFAGYKLAGVDIPEWLKG